MYLKSLIALAVAVGLFQLGALSVWVAVLQATLSIVLATVFAIALYFVLMFLWRRHKERDINGDA